MRLLEFSDEIVKSSVEDLEQGEAWAVAIEALAEVAGVAVRAGVRPTLEDLVNPLEREAWTRAARTVAVERALRNGMATKRGGAEIVLGELDGGAAAMAAHAAATARAVATKVKERR